MHTWSIKGLCENCGFAYQGDIYSMTKSFPHVQCPGCKNQTENFEEEQVVDELNKYEHSVPDYKAFILKNIQNELE